MCYFSLHVVKGLIRSYLAMSFLGKAQLRTSFELDTPTPPDQNQLDINTDSGTAE